MDSKYKSISEWSKSNPSAYQSAKKAGIIPDICETFGWDLPKENTKLHPNGYWKIKENVLCDALKYETPTEWTKNNATAYAAARKHGWFEEATAHMTFLFKPNGYWNAETIFEESKKYKTPQEWKKGSSSSYAMSFKIEGLYDKCIDEMGYIKAKPAGYWNAERIFEESKKYNNPKEWKKGSSSSYSMAFKIEGLYAKCLIEMGFDSPKKIGYWQIKENVLAEALKYKTRSEWGTGPNSHGASYNSAKKNGWFEEATAHMLEINKPTGYWTKEVLLETAKKYKYYSDWLKNEKGAYQAALKQNLIDECTSHMIFSTARNGHWQIKENVLAEALNYKTRSDFSKNSPGAYNSAKQNGWYKECTAHMEYAEGHTPAGFWTKEKVLSIAKKYDNRLDWVKGDEKSVWAARTNGWIDECLEHMELLKKPPMYWNDKEKCLEDALKYKSKSEWQKKSSAAKKSAMRNGWYEECTVHMVEIQKPMRYWQIKEHVLAEALKYDNIKDWRLNGGASLEVSRRNGWYEECTAHMELSTKKGYWDSKETVLTEALKYKTRSEWSKNSSSSYNSAKKNGWFEEATAHMVYLVKPNGYWTRELLITEARKWSTPKEWRELGEGFSRAKPLGCYDECVTHMKQDRKPSGYWKVKEHVLAEALKYKNKVEWQEKSNGSMKEARKNGWLDECSAHMKTTTTKMSYNV